MKLEKVNLTELNAEEIRNIEGGVDPVTGLLILGFLLIPVFAK